MDSDIVKLRATNGFCFGQDAVSLVAIKENDNGLFMATHLEYKKCERYSASLVFQTLDTISNFFSSFSCILLNRDGEFLFYLVSMYTIICAKWPDFSIRRSIMNGTSLHSF